MDAYWEPLVNGYLTTLKVTASSGVVAVVIAIVLGALERSGFRMIRVASRAIVEFFRGTSTLVQLFWVFFALPILTGIQISPFAAAVCVLGLNLGSFGAEVVRGGFEAVPSTQWQASRVLQLSGFRTFRRVIFPQALPMMLPPAANLYIELLKVSAYVGLVQVHDLMFWADQIRLEAASPLILYGVVLIAYYLTSLGIIGLFHIFENSTVLRRAERRSSNGIDRRNTEIAVMGS